MIGRANARVSILRGTVTNTYGDVVDSDSTVHRGVKISIIERTRRTYLKAEGASRVIRTLTGRTTAGVDIAKGDRLRDERHPERVYLVVDINEKPGALGGRKPDIVLELSRTT